jgi:hypothetical protein
MPDNLFDENTIKLGYTPEKVEISKKKKRLQVLLYERRIKCEWRRAARFVVNKETPYE